MKTIGICARIALVAFLLSFSFRTTSARTVYADSLAFDRAVADSPLDLLQGRVAGVRVFSTDGNINGMSGVHIRGIRSLRNDAQPLYILDGAVLGTATNSNADAFWQYDKEVYNSALNPFSFLSAYDIESIDVLKDVSAAAIYGPRGANGVISIKTRKAGKESFNLDWNSNFTAYPVFAHNHSLSLSGTQKRNTYVISAFYRNKAGVVARNRADDAGVRFSFETAANSALNFGFSSILSVSSSSNPSGTAWFGKGSSTLSMIRPSLSSGVTAEDWAAGYDDDVVDCRTVSSAYLKINILPFLYWRTEAGIDYQNINRIVWCGNETLFGRANGGAAAVLNSMLLNYNADSRLVFSRCLSGRHDLTAIAGVDVNGNRNSFNTMNGTRIMTHELRGKGLSLMQSDKEVHRFVRNYFTGGVFASAGYDYARVTGIEVRVRADVTPKYMDWNPEIYPSVEGYVDLHRALLKDFRIVSSLKLKGGWGICGKELYVPYELTSEHLTGQWYKVGADAAVYYDGLDRVVTSGWNASLELGLLSDRLVMNLSYYDDLSHDTYEMYCFGEFDGLYWDWADRRQVFGRRASFLNRGFDFSLDADVIEGRSWRWSVYADLSYNVNQALHLTRHDVWGKSLGGGLAGTVNIKGASLGSFGGFEENEDGSLKDITRDGNITAADRVVLGNSVPVYHGGFGTTLNFRGICLDVRFDGAAGFSIANLTAMARDGKKELSSSYVEDGDYLRLSRVSLGYDIPIGLKWIRSLMVHASAHNLFTFTSYGGNTPDVSSYGVSPLAYGFDYGSYPAVPSVVLGVSAKF